MSPDKEITVDIYEADPPKSLQLVDRYRDEIPHLRDVPVHEIRGQLLRYRGMIQDIPNPVFYYESYGVRNVRTGQLSKRSGKYRDGLSCGSEEKLLLEPEESVNSERRPYFCVGIPALNDWARPVTKGRSNCEIVERTNGVKRNAEEMDEDVDEGVKRQCGDDKRQGDVMECGGSLDLPWEDACVIHVYDPSHWDVLKVNNVVDVVAFAYASTADQDDVQIPPSLAPRLHVIDLNVLSHSKISPSVPTLRDNATLRNDLHLAFAQLLLGDHLAADYLICHLLANVYHRRDFTVLGKFSLNISNVPTDQNYTSGFHDILSLLLPKSLLFPMSIRSMNESNLVPFKDYETNRLKTGILQLCDRTQVVIDETQLDVGKLVDRGVRNVQALNTLLTEQVVNYDFKYYTVPFPTNIPVLVLSEGKSLLQCDTHVKLIPDPNCDSSLSDILIAVRCYLQEQLLADVRSFLASSPSREFTIPDDLLSTIQDDFVRMRGAEVKMSPDEMHSLLVFARLLALSWGHSTLSKDIWDKAIQLETARRERL